MRCDGGELHFLRVIETTLNDSGAQKWACQARHNLGATSGGCETKDDGKKKGKNSSGLNLDPNNQHGFQD